MRAFALIACLSAVAPAHAEPIDVPPEMREAVQKAAMRLAFADGCDRRLDRPEMVSDAETALSILLKKAAVPDAEAKALEVAKSLRDRPQEKESGPFTLFNEKMCGNLAKSLKDEISDASR